MLNRPDPVMSVVVRELFDIRQPTVLFEITVILSGIASGIACVVRRIPYEHRMRRGCSSSQIYAGIKSGRAMAPPPIIVGFIPNYQAVCAANRESTAVVIVGNVVTNYSIRRPYFESTDGPPSASLRSIKTGTPAATDVADDGWRVRAGQTLYKDTAA